MTEHRITLTALAAKYAVAHAAHHVFSPSGSWLWLTCAGGLIPNLLAKDEAGFDAAYGTVGHGVGETWLKTERRPDYLVGTVENVGRYDIEIDDQMLDEVQQYVDWCQPLEGVHFVETHVDFSKFTPLPFQGGTCDHAAARPGYLTITDLKLGKGVVVPARNNPQLMLYALGFFLRYDDEYHFQYIEMRIAQPRVHHWDRHVINRYELLAFAEHVRVRSHLAWQLDAPRTPSEKACQFCKVKATCGPAVALQATQTAGMFDDLVDMGVDDVEALKDRIEDGDAFKFANLMTLTTDQLVRLMPFKNQAIGWWKAVEIELAKRTRAGQTTNMKFVRGRSFRSFKNDFEAGNVLIANGVDPEVAFPLTVISPSKAEDELRKVGVKGDKLKNVMMPLVIKPPGKPTLVPLYDKRPAITNIDDDEIYADLTETEVID